MKPIEVFAINDKMYRATLTLPYKSLEWHRCYNKCGDFTLEIPADIYDQSWRFIYTDDRPETGIIESVQLQDSGDAQKVDTIVLKGRFLESIMNRRVFLDEKVETITYTYERHPIEPPSTDIVKPGLYVAKGLQEGGTIVWERPGGTYIGDPSSGDVISASEVKEDENGKYIEAGSTRIDVDELSYTQSINTYFYEDEDNPGVITGVKNTGTELVETDYNISFKDGLGNVYYSDIDGNLHRAFGVVNKKEDVYWYEQEQRDIDGNTVSVTKTVNGPWQRTEIDDVTVPADNVAKCVSYANRFFQNGMIFEEPEFTGTTKIIDPSLQYLGDLLYSELSQEGASFRVVYDFVLNQFVFSVWKGLDRTQSQTHVEVDTEKPTWLTTGKVQSAEIETNPGSQVGKIIIYGASKPGESSLPEGYTELEYIESTGTQYIDTGFKPNQDTRITMSAIPTSTSTTGTGAYFFGSSYPVQLGGIEVFLYGTLMATVCGNLQSDKAFNASAGEMIEIDCNKNVYTISASGGAEFYNEFVVAPYSSPVNLRLMALARSTNIYGAIKMFECKIFDNDSLIRNFVPCKDASGNIGMYDLQNSMFYGNSGSGSFVAGPELEIPDVPISNVALSINGEKWNLNLGGKTLGDGQTLTVNRDGTSDIDGTSIDSQTMPYFQSRNVSVFTDSDLPHYFDMEYQKYQEPAPGLNPFYVFSDTWGTLYNYSVTEDESAYKNKCFVMYEYSGSDYTTSGLPDYVSTQDGKRGIITVRLEDDLSDRETYLDMRNESDALDDGESQTFMQYLEALYEKGKSYLLTECGKIKELDTDDLTMAEYMNGFDLGDKVDMLVESTGLIQEARIIEVSEVYKAEGPDIQITLGEAELKEV